jgi:hypothetical protein
VTCGSEDVGDCKAHTVLRHPVRVHRLVEHKDTREPYAPFIRENGDVVMATGVLAIAYDALREFTRFGARREGSCVAKRRLSHLTVRCFDRVPGCAPTRFGCDDRER